jgi:hypothetical protein
MILLPAENEDSTTSKDDAQKVNALEEVLEEAPKWKVLRVRGSVFVPQFSSIATLFTSHTTEKKVHLNSVHASVQFHSHFAQC